MNLYLSSFTLPVLEEYLRIFPHARLNILLSYGLRNKGYLGFIEKYSNNINSLVLDSGTFTLEFSNDKKAKDKISIMGYQAFIKKYANHFSYCFSFDKYFGSNSALRNYQFQKKLEDIAGDKIIPVVHQYDNFEELDFYIHNGHKLVALGYSDIKRKNIKRFAHYAHKHGVKVHALGISNYAQLAEAPIQLCDSTSWVWYSNVGQIIVWNKDKSGDDKTERYYFVNQGKRESKKEGKYFSDPENYDFLSEYLKTELNYGYYDVLSQDRIIKETVNVHYFQKLQEKITEIHIQKGYVL